eukprot:g76994.t1
MERSEPDSRPQVGIQVEDGTVRIASVEAWKQCQSVDGEYKDLIRESGPDSRNRDAHETPSHRKGLTSAPNVTPASLAYITEAAAISGGAWEHRGKVTATARLSNAGLAWQLEESHIYDSMVQTKFSFKSSGIVENDFQGNTLTKPLRRKELGPLELLEASFQSIGLTMSCDFCGNPFIQVRQSYCHLCTRRKTYMSFLVFACFVALVFTTLIHEEHITHCHNM